MNMTTTTARTGSMPLGACKNGVVVGFTSTATYSDDDYTIKYDDYAVTVGPLRFTMDEAAELIHLLGVAVAAPSLEADWAVPENGN